MSLSRSAKFYRDNPDARRRKAKTDAEINRRPEQKKKRAEANKKNRDKGTYGNGDKKDYDHATNRFVSEKTNRGRRGEGGR